MNHFRHSSRSGNIQVLSLSLTLQKFEFDAYKINISASSSTKWALPTKLGLRQSTIGQSMYCINTRCTYRWGNRHWYIIDSRIKTSNNYPWKALGKKLYIKSLAKWNCGNSLKLTRLCIYIKLYFNISWSICRKYQKNPSNFKVLSVAIKQIFLSLIVLGIRYIHIQYCFGIYYIGN